MDHSMHDHMNHSGMDHNHMGHITMNHSTMGHGSTTPSGMDHHGHGDHGDHGGGMVGGDHMGMMMNMFFTTKWQETYVLFEQCQLTEGWQLAVACILLAIIAALYEGLKVFREHLLYTYQIAEQESTKRNRSEGEIYLNESSPSSSKVEITSTRPPPTIRSHMFSWLHFSQTVLHMLQITVSYLLMLVVMTYNLYLCLSVVIGAGLGYFLFGWKRSVISDRNEHCH